jgi:hypothetical protein
MYPPNLIPLHNHCAKVTLYDDVIGPLHIHRTKASAACSGPSPSELHHTLQMNPVVCALTWSSQFYKISFSQRLLAYIVFQLPTIMSP